MLEKRENELHNGIIMKKSFVVGVDVGGTNTVVGIVDARGTILKCDKLKTRAFGANVEAYLDALAEHILNLVEACGVKGQVGGVGIGAPNGNYYTGKIEFAANLPWKESIPICEELKKRLGIPVSMTNDAKATAIGEMTYGAAKGMKNFILITLGTGIGSGIVIDSKVVYGHDGLAGELGHLIIRRNGRPCGCGRKGCLETYCSASGMAQTARELLLARPDEPSLLRDIPTDSITSKIIYDAAVQGDALAKEIFDTTGRILGEALADFVTFSSPEAIILFGGMTAAGELLMRPVREAFDANLMRVFDKPKLLFSLLSDSDAAILGAAALGWEAAL